MSSCYQFCKVLLRKNLWTKNFRILFIGKIWVSLGSLLPRRTPRGLLGSHLTMISIPRSWWNNGHASGRIIRSWKGQLSFKSLHNTLLGLTDFIAVECEQYHLLTNSFVQNFHFHYRNNPPEESFNLYAENHQIPLTEFCDICMLPFDGDLQSLSP